VVAINTAKSAPFGINTMVLPGLCRSARSQPQL
jgi:hypothetical protein